MRLVLRILTKSPRTWRDVIGTTPSSLYREDRPDGTIVLARPEAGADTTEPDYAVTGLRLTRDDRGPAIELPLFCGTADLALASQLAPMLVTALDGTVEVDGRVVAAGDDARVFEDELAPPFIHQAMARFEAIARGSDTAVCSVEGYRRPYFLGVQTAMRALALANGDFADGYLRFLSIAAAIEELGDATACPRIHKIRTPDGTEARYAVWDPRQETLLPPCDFALVAETAEGTYVRVAAADLERVVTASPGVAHGARVDELQWLLVAVGDADAEAVLVRARDAGRTLKVRPGTFGR